jgi:hypothetical protein
VTDVCTSPRSVFLAFGDSVRGVRTLHSREGDMRSFKMLVTDDRPGHSDFV